jgi:hypothetical protein
MEFVLALFSLSARQATIVIRSMWFSKTQCFGRLCLVIVAAAGSLIHHTSVSGDADPPPSSATSEGEAAQQVRKLMRLSPSFDTAPVYFFIKDTLFAVPRNLIVQMPDHVVEDPRLAIPPEAGAASNRVILHVMLPDMAGLTEVNAECYMRGSDCDKLVRIIVTEETPGTALIRREDEQKHYNQWGGEPLQTSTDLWAFPMTEGTGHRYYLGRLTPDVSVLFKCNVPSFFAPLCSTTTGMERGTGTLSILFNKAHMTDGRLVYEGVQRLVAILRVEK